MCELKKYHKTSNTQIDKCMRDEIKKLKEKGIKVVACCCGHDKYPKTIVSKSPFRLPFLNTSIDVGEITWVEYTKNKRRRHIVIKRIRNFYKKDKQGFYYIPEVSGVKPNSSHD